MKREVDRKLKLPAFSLTISQLDVLMTRLLALFEEKEKVHARITVTLKNEKLSFESTDELRSYPHLRGRITDFSIWVSERGSSTRRVSISSGSLPFDNRPSVWANAETEAWCAGAVETVHSFLLPHRLWYHWLLVAPIGWLLVILGNVPIVAKQFAATDAVMKSTAGFAWLSTFLALVVLWFARDRLLPPSILRVSEDESFIRRHAPELGVLIGLVSAVLTLVSLLFGKAT